MAVVAAGYNQFYESAARCAAVHMANSQSLSESVQQRAPIAIAGIMSPAFSLRLYDLLGREVAILSEGHGHGTMINYTAPPDLATGVYFLRASDATTVQTRKVVFLK